MACLDTSTLLDLSGPARIRARVQRQVRALRARGETLATTRFNVAELWVGIHRSRDPRLELRRVKALIRPLVVLDFDQRAAEFLGGSSATSRKRATPSATWMR